MRAFTLIELLVYTAVLSLVLALSAQFVLGALEAAAKSAAKEKVQASIANILQAFDFEVREAQSVYVPTSDFASDPGQLSLLSVRAAPANEQTSYIDIYEDGGRFCVKRESTGVSCLSQSGVEVSGLRFIRIVQPGGVESVQMLIAIQNRSIKSEYQFSQTVQTTARLRSY